MHEMAVIFFVELPVGAAKGEGFVTSPQLTVHGFLRNRIGNKSSIENLRNTPSYALCSCAE